MSAPQNQYTLFYEIVQESIKNKNVSEAATSDCFAFIDYLISAKKIPGPNIFPPAAKKEPTDEQKDQKAFFSHELSDVVFTRFFERLNSKISTAYCGVALYASGFTYENEIEELRWKDLKFVKGYTDFVVVPVHKDHLVISKHDFSRPAIPDTALYLRRVYHHLCKCYGRDKVNTWRIIAEKEKDKKDKSKDTYIDKPIEKKALGKIANNLLLLAGYDFGQQNCNSSTDTHANTALKVLTDNYYRMLVTRAGLANDADTRSFLQGTVLRSSTYTNYESHTSPEAQYRLYKILLPVSSEKKINPPSIKDKSTFAATPKTNHEVAQIIGKIRLKPGEGITIEVPSGVTGTIEANDFDGAKPFVNINKDDCAT